MSSLHDGGCAVVLQDGRILVGGGSDASGATAKVEIFNTDGSWSSAPPMLSPRTHQACAALQDGQVLVAGGTTTGGGVTNSAEIFDPVANAWSQLSPMSEARAGATTSLLQDGRVLLAGGQTTAGPSNSMEIFDPSSQTFNFAATMSASRQDAAAVLLQDGRVLIVGGSGVDANGNAAVLGSSDIYDPSTGSVSPGPTLVTARSKHSATVQLDGKVAVIGGNDGSNDLASIEVYDPLVAGNFNLAAASLATPRSGHLAFLLPKNNEVLVAGGQSAGVDMASAELYVPWGNQGAGAEQSTGSMAAARSQASGAPLSTTDGLLLVAGGSAQSSTELYSFATVTTDQSDYAPGTTVTITGGGWQPGETVTLTLVESPLIDSHPVMTAVADQNGNILNNQFSPDSHDVNVRFYLTATGSQSQAQHTFTDAAATNVNFAAAGLPSGTAITATILSYTNNGGQQKTNVAVPFTAPGPSVNTGTQPGTSFSYSFPGNITGADGKAYQLSSSSPVSPFTTPANGVQTVTATYAPACTPVSITSQPSNQTVTYGQTATFSVTSSGTAPVNYQWLKNSLPISGATTSSYSFSPQVADSGSSFNVQVSNACTSPAVTSSTAMLTVNKAAAILTLTASSLNQTYSGSPEPVTTTTNPSGLSVTATYNGSSTVPTNAGSYSVVATVSDPNYAGSASGTLVIGKAAATIAVTAYNVPYDGNAHTASGTATGVKGESLPGLDLSGTTHTNAGDYATDAWTFTDSTGNYSNDNGSVHDAIAKANATVNVTPYSLSYDGNAHTATGTASGVKGEALSGLDLSSTTHTNAGDYTADAWSFTDPTGNYANSSGTVHDFITKAKATVTVTPYSLTYDGNAHTATGSATGVKNENLVGLDLSGTTHTNAGDYPADAWTFTDSTGNYNNANGTMHDAIAKANATMDVTPYTVTYDGNAHTATGSATGVKNESLSGLDLSGTTHTNAGDYAADAWTFTDSTGNYNNASGTVHDAIAKANATFTVTPYNVTYDGNAHTATGSATGVKNESLSGLNLSGTTHTDAGDYASDTYTFIDPTGNYNNASGTTHDHIDKANSTVAITVSDATYDGNPHGGTAVVTGAGRLNQSLTPDYTGTNFSWEAYGPTETAPTHAGTYLLSASFVGDNNHNPSNNSANFMISRASSSTVVTVSGGASFTYDSTSHPATVSVTGAGGLNLAPAPLPLYSCGHVPTYVADNGCIASYNYPGDNDHTASSGNVTYSITRAPLVATANSMSMVLDAPLPQLTGSLAGVLGADGISATYTTAATGTVIGTFPITPVLSDPNNRLPNYNLTSNNGTLTVQYAAAGVCYGDYGHQILAPVAANGTSTFKQGSTIPAKFRVCDALGNSISAVSATGVPVVSQFNLIGIISGTVTQTVDQTVASTTPDTAFRWDATGQQWIFNISTKPLPIASTYVYQIVLNDGSKIQFQYGLPR